MIIILVVIIIIIVMVTITPNRARLQRRGRQHRRALPHEHGLHAVLGRTKIRVKEWDNIKKEKYKQRKLTV